MPSLNSTAKESLTKNEKNFDFFEKRACIFIAPLL